MIANKTVIKLSHLTKSFGKHTILKDLNFQVEKGKITTILGFSGSGKSTLLKHVLGLLKPTSGSVEVLGQDLQALDPYELREFRQNFGMLFQYAALFDSFSTYENVAFPIREFTDASEEEIAARVSSLLEAVGLDQTSFDKLPSELSGGMRKRVGLARGLALNPKIMLYDEPTTGLDPITTKMVNDLIVETNNRESNIDLTSVIISHDIKATLEISDFVAFLEHGKIVEHATVEEFKKSTNPRVRKFLDL